LKFVGAGTAMAAGEIAGMVAKSNWKPGEKGAQFDPGVSGRKWLLPQELA